MRIGAVRTQHDWLGHVQPTGLVVAPAKLDELGLIPLPQDQADNDEVAAVLGPHRRSLPDAWAFLAGVLGWRATRVQGAPDGPPLPDALTISLRDGDTVLAPTYAVPAAAGGDGWDLLVRVEAPGVALDERGVLPGWEATAHQRFERLLRETGVGAGVLIGARATGRSDEATTEPELRLVVAPKGETSGWIAWPLASLASVAGREMLAGLKLLLGPESLWGGPAALRLPAVLDASRKAQAAVSERLSGQVLAALHELLRGLDSAAPELTRELAARDPQRLYEGLLTVLMRLIFLLYAEDRGLMPSSAMPHDVELYERGYSLGALFVKLSDDEALHPDLMDERRGAWGRVLALFRLVARGADGFTQRRGGRLFDEARFPFLLGRRETVDHNHVLPVSDGCLLRVLERLMTLPNPRTRERERLSYRTLDVEQIGSVYETVMGFTVEIAEGPSLAIRAGKNNRVPVFVDLSALVAIAPRERIKRLKELTGRGQFPAAATRALLDAADVAALAAGLGAVADERGSPRQDPTPPGGPILQPTDERRRTGSHYTPRSLTAPIVTHALEPAFERIGDDATPAQVLDLKVCDPAVGSGAFLVEACRQLGARLMRAWEAHKDLKPPIPADEDDELHARRLVAQRCLYGVDRNPMALDLAKLSLWLATLARDHEFSFLDHALKSGDSLVGLSRAQIEAASWETNAPPNLWRLRVREDVERALQHREAIRAAPDDVALAMQEAQHARVERGLENVRLIGDAVIGSFFAEAKPKARKAALADVALAAGGAAWERLRTKAERLAGGAHPVRPFHWEVEFPEVFARENPGFDAIVGNPPFLGGKRVSAELGEIYKDWLYHDNVGANQNIDLVGHFFLRAFGLVRRRGAFGFIATNTIKQGATREGSLLPILQRGGSIYRATRRMRWPGEAAVVVSVVHILKGPASHFVLDERIVSRISAYLMDSELDTSPGALRENRQKAFVGAYLLGKGFVFDDAGAQRGESPSLSDMSILIAGNRRISEVIKPFIGSEEINTSPSHQAHRFCIDLGSLSEADASYRYPELMQIIRRLVKPLRNTQKRSALREKWWQYAERQVGLFDRIAHLDEVLIAGQTSKYSTFTFVKNGQNYSHKTIVFCSKSRALFASLQSRVHELWIRTFGPTMKDDPVYTPSDCFEPFPLPMPKSSMALDQAGEEYFDTRAELMLARNEGMTQTYTRFHDPQDVAADIARLRELHSDMDSEVLAAYGWDDLAVRAAPEFLTEETEDDHTYQGRLFWPAGFRDEVLARLLNLNEERVAEERRVGGD